MKPPVGDGNIRGQAWGWRGLHAPRRADSASGFPHSRGQGRGGWGGLVSILLHTTFGVWALEGRRGKHPSFHLICRGSEAMGAPYAIPGGQFVSLAS